MQKHFICVQHFVDGLPTQQNPDPVTALPSTSYTPFRRHRSFEMTASAGQISKDIPVKVLLQLSVSY